MGSGEIDRVGDLVLVDGPVEQIEIGDVESSLLRALQFAFGQQHAHPLPVAADVASRDPAVVWGGAASHCRAGASRTASVVDAGVSLRSSIAITR